MRDASRFNARAMLAGVVVVGAIVVAVSGLAFGAGKASARSSSFIPFWYTVMTHQQAHWDEGCNCFKGYDTVTDGFDRDFGSSYFPPEFIHLSPPVALGPIGTQATAARLETFGGTHIKGFHEFQMSPDGTTAKLMASVTAPAGVNGATVSTQTSSGVSSQVVTWSTDGVAVGSPVSVDISYYIDFAAKQKIACANGFVSPPIALEATLMNSDGTTSAGRPALEPCKYLVARTITVTK